MRGEFRRGHVIQTAVGTFVIVFVSGAAPPEDIDGDGRVDAFDVQLVIDAALGG